MRTKTRQPRRKATPRSTPPAAADEPAQDDMTPQQRAAFEADGREMIVEAARFLATCRHMHRACRSRHCRSADRCRGNLNAFACGIDKLTDGTRGELIRLILFAAYDRARRDLARSIKGNDMPF